ncbi:MAG: maleylacetoacetate isomerase [Rhodospirillaceae bacterium]
MLKLYDYPRSSAAYRVRIALALKGLTAESTQIHLLKDGGQQHMADYRVINPQGLVPAVEIDGHILTQSLAIIEYLDERHPDPPLLPADPFERAHVRALALTIAADIHPLQNLRIGNALRKDFGAGDEQVVAWNRHWIEIGLKAFQAMVRPGPYCWGTTVTLADVFLAPQMVNARRFGCDLAALDQLVEIDAALRAMPAFASTAPEALG